MRSGKEKEKKMKGREREGHKSERERKKSGARVLDKQGGARASLSYA